MNLQLNCPIGYTGYGYASLNIVKELYRLNTNIGLHPIGNPSIEDETDALLIKKILDNALQISYNTTTIKIWHQFDLLSRIGNGKYVAFPFFEIDKLNDLEKYHLNYPDTVFVSSSWAKEVLVSNNITTKIDIVPLGVDTNIFYPQSPEKQNDTYVFCTIGKWEKRKNHDIIIECFNRSFEDKDNVELWMVTHNPFLNTQEEQAWLNLVSSSKLKNKIKIFPRLSSHKEVAKVISYSDCGIYVSRGEGWNMELLETMAMNKPVIASDYSAHTEYCNNQNSFIVNITETEPAYDNKWFFGQGNWARFDQTQKDQTIEHMRHVYKNRISTNQQGVETARNYTWENTAKKILSLV